MNLKGTIFKELKCKCWWIQKRFTLNTTKEWLIKAEYKCDSCLEYTRYVDWDYFPYREYNKQELLNIANKYFLEWEPTFGNIVQEALYKIEEFNRIPEIIEFEEIPESVMFTKHDIILERIRIYEELVQKFDYDNDKKVLKELIYLSGLI